MPEHTQWEYRILTISNAFGTKYKQIEATLNDWGSEGLEAIRVYTPSQNGKATIITRRLLTASARRRRTWPGQ